MALALFDLDETLLNGDSDYEWGLHMVEIGRVDADVYARENERFYKEYLAGTMDVNNFLSFALKPLSENSYADLVIWRKDFIEKRIKPIIKNKAWDLIDAHRSKGDYLVIVTATNEFITEPLKEILQVNELLATVPEMKNGEFTGNVVGQPNFGSGKVNRVQNWLQSSSHTLEGSYFYSDSRNDIPLLEIVDNPITVDADEALRTHAKKNNWKQISLL